MLVRGVNFDDIVHLSEKLLGVCFVNDINEVVQAVEELYQLFKVRLKLRQPLDAFFEDSYHVFLWSSKVSSSAENPFYYRDTHHAHIFIRQSG
jgi:hypothetical protein